MTEGKIDNIYSLNDEQEPPPTQWIGGKAAGLMKLCTTEQLKRYVPRGFAVSEAFFQTWMNEVLASNEYKAATDQNSGVLSTKAETGHFSESDAQVCSHIQALINDLLLSPEQSQTLQTLQEAISSWPGAVAAVRSSAPEEDGDGASFAGLFVTKLGVSVEHVELALRECFASVFDQKVSQYGHTGWHPTSFSAVVMEMVEPSKAGVAFSANPLNSDLDEMVVDSSWGLGESVVDGSIMADRFIWDKLGSVVLETKIGNKERERRVCASGGGVEELQVSEERAGQTTLSEDELLSLAKLVSSVEAAYGKPVDVEWAYTQQGELKLLQARPITTIFPLDPAMLTKPGEPRRLYFDFHIASDATTIHPFTHMDLDAYWEVWTKATGFGDISHPPDDSGDHLFFNGATRQYINVSATSRLGYSPSTMTKEYEQIDLYAASILKGKEATNPKYKADKLPDDVTFANAWWLFRRMPLWHMYIMKNKFKANPVQCGSELRLLLTTARADMKAIVAKGPTSQGGLIEYVNALARAAFPALDLQCAGAFLTLSVFKELGRQNKAGETQQIRDEAAAMMLGYKGDPLMEMNIAMYHLAQSLPVELWAEYDDKLDDLSDRIQRNVESRASTGDKLPAAFITSWKAFMSDFGYDGTDQLFVSSPRYHEQPVLLLQKIRHSAGTDVKDPEQAMLQARDRRQAAQKAQLDAAKANAKWYKSTVQAVLKRNEALDEVMWIRNSPKLFQSEILSAVRTGVLVCETQLLEANRLDEAGDVFHLKLSEVDRGLCCPELDLRYLIAPRKAQYLRTKRAGMTPFLVDSRCRILKPDVKEQQPGTLVGMAIAPGVATGRLRILKSPSEKIGRGDILATVVTDPAWTPLFIGCAAVVLQVGGALQHGALCAREYGKPGVSCIDMADLTDGMMVSVDGNTGVVTILAEE